MRPNRATNGSFQASFQIEMWRVNACLIRKISTDGKPRKNAKNFGSKPSVRSSKKKSSDENRESSAMKLGSRILNLWYDYDRWAKRRRILIWEAFRDPDTEHRLCVFCKASSDWGWGWGGRKHPFLRPGVTFNGSYEGWLSVANMCKPCHSRFGKHRSLSGIDTPNLLSIRGRIMYSVWKLLRGEIWPNGMMTAVTYARYAPPTADDTPSAFVGSVFAYYYTRRAKARAKKNARKG